MENWSFGTKGDTKTSPALPAGRISKWCSIAIGLCILTCVVTQHASAEDITWEDCVKLGRKANPQLIAGRTYVPQAEADRKQANSARLPKLSAGASGSKSQSGEGEENNSYSADLSLSQLIYDGGKSGSQVAQADARVKSAAERYRALSASVRQQLRTAFVQLLRAQEGVRISKDILGRRSQSTRLINMRYEAGREHKGSLMTAKAKEAQAVFDVEEAVRDIEVAQWRMSALLGCTNRVEFVAKSDFGIKTLPSVESLTAIAGKVPSVVQLELAKESAELSVKSARSAYYPNISAGASTGRGGDDFPLEDEGWSARISVSLPLFDGLNREASVTKAKSALEAALADVNEGRSSAVTELAERWKALQDAIGTVELQKQYAEATRERARISDAQYQTGQVSFDNWLLIEDDMVSAERSLLESMMSAMVAEANWVKALGGTLEE